MSLWKWKLLVPTIRTWNNICFIFIISAICCEYIYDISAFPVWVFVALVPSMIIRPIYELKDIPECISFNRYSIGTHLLLVPFMKIVAMAMLGAICYQFGNLDGKLWFEDACRYLDANVANFCLVLPDSVKVCISYAYGAIDGDSFVYALNSIGLAITAIVAMWFCNYVDFEGDIAEHIRLRNNVEEILNDAVNEEN